jgi:hypothetical protein
MRKGVARGARKKSAVRRTTRKAASRPRESPRRVNLKPLQAIIKSQIERLESYPSSPKVDETLRLMRDTKAMLDNACRSNPLPMVIEF